VNREVGGKRRDEGEIGARKERGEGKRKTCDAKTFLEENTQYKTPITLNLKYAREG